MVKGLTKYLGDTGSNPVAYEQTWPLKWSVEYSTASLYDVRLNPCHKDMKRAYSLTIVKVESFVSCRKKLLNANKRIRNGGISNVRGYRRSRAQ